MDRATTDADGTGVECVAALHRTQMNYADIILDLVSTGTTLRENNLKELAGAVIMESEGVLVARRTALLQQPETLAIVREMLERVEAHLKAEAWFTVRTCLISSPNPSRPSPSLTS